MAVEPSNALAKRRCDAIRASEMLVLVCHSRSYASLDLDHIKFTALQVGYHNHPSGGVFAGLRSRDKRRRETKDEKKTEDARNVSSHVSRMSHDRIACTLSTSGVHCIVINAGVLGELYMFHISSIKRMDNGDF